MLTFAVPLETGYRGQLLPVMLHSRQVEREFDYMVATAGRRVVCKCQEAVSDGRQTIGDTTLNVYTRMPHQPLQELWEGSCSDQPKACLCGVGLRALYQCPEGCWFKSPGW